MIEIKAIEYAVICTGLDVPVKAGLVTYWPEKLYIVAPAMI